VSTTFTCVPQDKKYQVTPSPNLGQFQFALKGLFGVAPSGTLRQSYVAPKTNIYVGLKISLICFKFCPKPHGLVL
jgi:hypothetical protein